MDEEYPISLLNEWLLETIINKVATYTNNTNAIVSKGFVKDGQCQSKSAITRVFKFLKTTKEKDLVAVIADSAHKAIAVFPFETALRFERKYRQRITFCTPNSLFHIKLAHLRFVSPLQLKRDYGATPNPVVDTVVIEVVDFDIFQRDQLALISRIDNKLTFVYDDPAYLRCFQNEQELHLKGQQQIEDDYDGMLSS